MEEIWRDIIECPHYQVSNLGNVRSMFNSNGSGFLDSPRTMRANTMKRGDKRIALKLANGKRRKFLVHTLVAAAFIGPKPEGHDINHLDGRPMNNIISNLEYATPKENVHHAFFTGIHDSARGSNHAHSKLTESDVKEMMRLRAEGKMTMTAIAKQFGVHICTFSDIYHGRAWNHVTHLPFSDRRARTDRSKWLPLRKDAINEFNQFKLHCHGLSP